MDLSEVVATTYIAPGGLNVSTVDGNIGVLYEITLGEMFIIVILALILIFLIVKEVVRGIWKK